MSGCHLFLAYAVGSATPTVGSYTPTTGVGTGEAPRVQYNPAFDEFVAFFIDADTGQLRWMRAPAISGAWGPDAPVTGAVGGMMLRHLGGVVFDPTTGDGLLTATRDDGTPRNAIWQIGLNRTPSGAYNAFAVGPAGTIVGEHQTFSEFGMARASDGRVLLAFSATIPMAPPFAWRRRLMVSEKTSINPGVPFPTPSEPGSPPVISEVGVDLTYDAFEDRWILGVVKAEWE